MTREELAQRIIDIDFYGARDAEATVESVAEEIATNPEDVIAYLLDMIDDLQAQKGEKEMQEQNLIMYHGQASKDPWAMVPDDLGDRIISTTMKAIKEAYKEFMDDLLLEAQEAYQKGAGA